MDLKLLVQIVATIGSIVVLLAILRQIQLARKQSEMALIQKIIQDVSEESNTFIERPELRPYFYAGKDVPPEGSEEERINHYHQVMAAAHKALTVLAGRVVLAKEFPEIYTREGTDEIIRKRFRDSPVLRHYLLNNFDEYPLTRIVLLHKLYCYIEGKDGDDAKNLLVEHGVNLHRDPWETSPRTWKPTAKEKALVKKVK